MFKKAIAAMAVLTLTFGAGYTLKKGTDLPEIKTGKSIAIEVSDEDTAKTIKSEDTARISSLERKTFNKTNGGAVVKNLPMRTGGSEKTAVQRLPFMTSSGENTSLRGGFSGGYRVCQL